MLGPNGLVAFILSGTKVNAVHVGHSVLQKYCQIGSVLHQVEQSMLFYHLKKWSLVTTLIWVVQVGICLMLGTT